MKLLAQYSALVSAPRGQTHVNKPTLDERRKSVEPMAAAWQMWTSRSNLGTDWFRPNASVFPLGQLPFDHDSLIWYMSWMADLTTVIAPISGIVGVLLGGALAERANRKAREAAERAELRQESATVRRAARLTALELRYDANVLEQSMTRRQWWRDEGV